MYLDAAIPLIAKICLVGMFPFSAYDKIAHWDEALKQASSGPLPAPAVLLVVAILVETLTPVLIVIGVCDRAAAFVLAGFCVVAAVLFHRFWEDPSFWSKNGKDRSHLWDFLKNFGLAGGLILVVVDGSYTQFSAVAVHPMTPGPNIFEIPDPLPALKK